MNADSSPEGPDMSLGNNSPIINNIAGTADDYTIIDVRIESKAQKEKAFNNSINIPLTELRERIREIPAHKPVVVHSAVGYSTAAGSSIIAAESGDKTTVFDPGDSIKRFLK